jgi:hypothetical protein
MFKREPPKEPHPHMPKHLLDKEEPPKTEWVKWVIRSLGILFVLLAVIAGVYFFKINGAVNTAQIVVNVVNLHYTTLSTVERGNLVSLTDDMVSKLNDPKVNAQWQRLIQCFPQGCDDKEYFGFLYVLVDAVNVPHARLITNIIVTQRYWGTGENILIFSRALTDVHTDITPLGSKVTGLWDKVVACDGTCADKNDQFFNLIKEVVKVQEQ